MYDTILFKFRWHSAEHEGIPLIKPLLLQWVTSLEGNISVVFHLLCAFEIRDMVFGESGLIRGGGAVNVHYIYFNMVLL